MANSLLASLASSSDQAPNFWLNPQNGVSYRVAVQTPQYRIDSIDALAREPIGDTAGNTQQLLANLMSFDRASTVTVATHYNVQPVFDVFASVQDRDLGGASRDIRRVLAAVEKELPRGSSMIVRGQVDSMNSAFIGLSTGLFFAVALVYALMVVNFQSWLDPFIIITALPGALDPVSRTLLTEVRMRNEGDLLRPGMFADVKFQLTRKDPPLSIPASALILRSGPPRVAVVAGANKVRFQTVQLGRDYGNIVEVVEGLSQKDRLLIAPPDDLQDGDSVRVIEGSDPNG